MARERISWQNPNFRVIDGTGNSTGASKDPRPISLVDRVMDEIGDTLPFEIIEGGRTEEVDLVREQPEAIIIFLDSYKQSKDLLKRKTSKNKTVLSKIKSFIEGFKNE